MLVGLDEAGLHSMHAIMPSTSCHDLKPWPTLLVVVAAAPALLREAAAVVVVVVWCYGSLKCEAIGACGMQ